MEIYQGSRQSYETSDGPRAVTPTDAIAGYAGTDCTPIKGDPGVGYVSQALAKGYLLAFESSSDHHSTHMSYANVWTADTSRQGILDAISKRRIYAATDLIVADVRIGTHFMGEQFTMSGAPTLTVKLQGTNSFDSVVVVKDGVIAYSTKGPSNLSFTWQDVSASPPGKQSYYYVRGVQSDQQVVWTSPMWVTLQ